VDRRINQGMTKVVATDAVKRVLLPSLACRLQQRIDTLLAVTLDEGAGLPPDRAYASARRQLTAQ
jgi:type VI secretion system protein ImpL